MGPKLWCHGDYVVLTEHGGLVMLGRSDGVLNPQGVRFGSAEIYDAIEDLPELVEVTLSATARAARDLDTVEIARAKAQLKVSLLSALETPGGRIERNARQILAWGRVIPASEVIAKVDAVTVDDVRQAGQRLLKGAPTLAAIGPIRKLPTLDRITAALKAA